MESIFRYFANWRGTREEEKLALCSFDRHVSPYILQYLNRDPFDASQHRKLARIYRLGERSQLTQIRNLVRFGRSAINTLHGIDFDDRLANRLLQPRYLERNVVIGDTTYVSAVMGSNSTNPNQIRYPSFTSQNSNITRNIWRFINSYACEVFHHRKLFSNVGTSIREFRCKNHRNEKHGFTKLQDFW